MYTPFSFIKQPESYPFIVADGGVVTIDGSYKVHTFTTVGTSSFNILSNGVNGSVDFLVVAGGGGGQVAHIATGGGIVRSGGMGGGAGGVTTGSLFPSIGNYNIIVGEGGIGASNNGDTPATSGRNSSALGITSNSGSGASFTESNSGNGFSGGTNTTNAAGGGGGAGAAGGNATTSEGGNGGNGVLSSISGVSTYYGGGGGGNPTGTGGFGGGGGAGGSGQNAIANTGGGGGGGAQGLGNVGGNGGTGIVIIRYPYKFDSNAQSFINVTGISGNEALAINTLVLDLKKTNLWTEMYALWPFVGGTSNSNRYNLIDTTQYLLSFTGSQTFNSTGWFNNSATTDNGARTGFNPITQVTDLNDFGIGYYAGNATSTGGIDIGSWPGSGGNSSIYLSADLAGGTGLYISDFYSEAQNRIVTANGAGGNVVGMWSVQRTANNVMKAYRGGTNIATNTTTRTDSPPNWDISIGGTATATQIIQNKDQKYQFLYFSYGLDDSQMTLLNTIVTNFQNNVGR